MNVSRGNNLINRKNFNYSRNTCSAPIMSVTKAMNRRTNYEDSYAPLRPSNNYQPSKAQEFNLQPAKAQN